MVRELVRSSEVPHDSRSRGGPRRIPVIPCPPLGRTSTVPQPDLNAAEWLASAATDPARLVRRWERDPLDVGLLAVGRWWDVVLAAGTAGRSALDRLTAHGPRPGPVLADTAGTRVCFLVPPGTAGASFRAGVRVVGAGAWLVAPHPEVTSRGLRWLVPPDGSGTLTAPSRLADALPPASPNGLAHYA
ncbi:bifunctional DNA primase/polymerase [Streptomyces sp. NPDC053794]|uniref:bifunctional DNA primase/polymerase n=1 Tax=Streptomyces sp. NPDC053794 TaxID=3154760 RepID=UPI0034476C6D